MRKKVSDRLAKQVKEAEDQKMIQDMMIKATPNAQLCEGILYLVKELKSRGFPLYDFDHKEKSLQQIQIIGDRIYFLAAKEDDNGGEKTEKKDDGF